MPRSSLINDIVQFNKQKIITAIVVDILGMLCSVRLSTNGALIRGLKYFGGKPSIGDTVYVNYQSGTPIVYTISDYKQVPSVAASPSSSRPPVPTPPISISENHNSLYGIQGGLAGDDDPSTGYDAEYYHLTDDEYINLIRGYNAANNTLQLGDLVLPLTLDPNTIVNSADGNSLARFGFVFADDPYRSDYDSTIRGGGTAAAPTVTKAGMIFKRYQGRGYYGDSEFSITPRRVEVRLVASRDWTPSSNPTQIEFHVTAPGSTNQYLAVMINDQGLINTYGNVIINGGFDADTDWLPDGGDLYWTIADGVATGADVSYECLRTAIAPLTIGTTYIVTFTLTTVTPGEDTIYWSDGVQQGTVRSANGIYSETFIAQGTEFYFESPTEQFNGTIDDVTVVYIKSTTGGGVAPVDPSVVGNLVSFSGISGEQADSGIVAADVITTGNHPHANGPKIDQVGDTGSTYGILTGARDGNNVEFTVSDDKYTSGTLLVYLNGQLLTQGSDADWHEAVPASGTFHFEVAPESTDKITAIYY